MDTSYCSCILSIHGACGFTCYIFLLSWMLHSCLLNIHGACGFTCYTLWFCMLYLPYVVGFLQLKLLALELVHNQNFPKRAKTITSDIFCKVRNNFLKQSRRRNSAISFLVKYHWKLKPKNIRVYSLFIMISITLRYESRARR